MFFCCNKCMADSPRNSDISDISDISDNGTSELTLSSFNINNYKPYLLGSGVTSKVYRIKIGNLYYTCKKIKSKSKTNVLREIDILKEVRGIRLPYFFKHIISRNREYILYNYISGRDLFDTFTANPTQFTQNPLLIAEVIYEIALGLQELFQYNYVHLDLKPENIIVYNLYPVGLKLVDLAYCSKLDIIKCLNNNGTYGYASPEVMLYGRYYHNSDIWALGVIAYILFTNIPLFPTNKRNTYVEDLNKFQNVHLCLDVDKIPYNALDLMEQMLQFSATYRFSIKDVLNHEFIKQINK